MLFSILPQSIQLEKNPRIKKSLLYSIIDGVFYSIKVGIGANSISSYGVFLKASDFQLGLLGTLPLVVGSIAQLVSNRLIFLLHSRRTIVALGVFLQAFMFLPILLTYFLSPNARICNLIFWVVMYQVFGMVINPAWNSWMGDLVPDDIRGVYFGKRTKIMEIATFCSMLFGGFILKTFSDGNTNTYIGFAVVFTIALLARIASSYVLTLKYDPNYSPEKSDHVTFGQFLKSLASNNYGIFVLFMCSMNLSIYFSSPYTSKFLLDEVKVGYFVHHSIAVVCLVSKCIFLPYWGQMCDEFGSRKVLLVSGFLMPLSPILWGMVAPVWYYLLVQVCTGFVLAGFELSAFNIIFDITDREHRLEYISYYNVINGLAIFLGGLLGAYAREFEIPYTTIFTISGIARYIILIIFIKKIKETRNVPYIRPIQLLSNLFYRIFSLQKASKKVA